MTIAIINSMKKLKENITDIGLNIGIKPSTDGYALFITPASEEEQEISRLEGTELVALIGYLQKEIPSLNSEAVTHRSWCAWKLSTKTVLIKEQLEPLTGFSAYFNAEKNKLSEKKRKEIEEENRILIQQLSPLAILINRFSRLFDAKAEIHTGSDANYGVQLRLTNTDATVKSSEHNNPYFWNDYPIYKILTDLMRNLHTFEKNGRCILRARHPKFTQEQDLVEEFFSLMEKHILLCDDIGYPYPCHIGPAMELLSELTLFIQKKFELSSPSITDEADIYATLTIPNTLEKQKDLQELYPFLNSLKFRHRVEFYGNSPSFSVHIFSLPRNHLLNYMSKQEMQNTFEQCYQKLLTTLVSSSSAGSTQKFFTHSSDAEAPAVGADASPTNFYKKP